MMRMDAEFSGRLLDATLNTIKSVICTSIGGERLYSCNDSFLDAFGYASLDAFKQTHECICELFVEDKEKGYIGSDVDGVRWSEYVYLHQKEKTVKTKIVSQGNERIYSINVEKLALDDENRYLVVLDDITIQEAYESSLKKEIEKQTYEIKHLYRLLSESEKISKTGVIEVRLEDDQDTWSDGIYQIFDDYDHETVPSFENGSEFIHPEDREEVAKKRAESLKNGVFESIDHRIITKTGREKYISVSGHYLEGKEGEGNRLLAILKDITTERRMEELEAENHKLALRQHHLNSLREMFRNISHHWRQPLNVISMTAATCLDENMTEEKLQESVKRIQQETDFLSRTIGHFSHVVLEKRSEEEVDIGKEVHEAIHLLTPKLQEENIVLEEEYRDEVILSTVPNEMTKIIYGMVENAMDSIQSKKSKYPETQGHIRVELVKTGSFVRLSIRDNGMGMSDEVAQKVFEPYFTTKFKSRGVGMSLSLDKYIIEHVFHGNITIHNKQEEGVTFMIEFPWKKR